MSDLKKIETEIIKEAETVEKRISGVFAGTLQIMTKPARKFLTEPLHRLYHARYHGKYRRPKHVFAFDLALIALGAALAGIAIYFGVFFKPFETVPVQLAILPKTPTSGGEIVLNLVIDNRGDSALNQLTASFKLPPEIKVLRSTPPIQKSTGTVVLDTIEPEGQAAVRLVAELSGPVGKKLKAVANIAYTDSVTGKTVKKGATATVGIAQSSVGADFVLPDQILVGQTVAASIHYFNRGNDPSENTVIAPTWPEGFVLTSSDPALKKGYWEIGTLAPGSEGQIAFTGFLGPGAANADFALETGIRSGADVLPQSQSLTTAVVSDPQISVTIIGKATAHWGDTVTLKANYKNSDGHDFSGVAFKAILDDGLTLAADQPGTLAIKAGSSGAVEFQVRLADRVPDALKTVADPQLKIRVALTGRLDGQDNISIASPNFVVKPASVLGLASIARYWSEGGDQLGRGPLPPNVGQTTRYWIFWNAKNTTGAVGNVRVSGVLPPNVSFTGKASVPFGDAPIFDPAARTLTWSAGDIPAFPGVTSPAIGVAFEVALIPTPDQAGTYPTLISDQKITGLDAVTGLALAGSAPSLTTELPSDPKAAGTGAVK